LKSERDEGDWCYEARDLLSFVGQGMSERDAAARARVSAEELRAWRRIPGFRRALRRARRTGGGLTANGICNLDQFLPAETPAQSMDREARERELRASIPSNGELWGPTYGPAGGRQWAPAS